MAAGQLFWLSARQLTDRCLCLDRRKRLRFTAATREMYADESMVLSIQHLRVLFVLGSIPIVAHLLGGDDRTERAGAAPGT